MTARRRLAELDFREHTGLHLDDMVEDWREAGASWRQIAQHVARATDGQVRVAHESLRRWYGELEGAA